MTTETLWQGGMILPDNDELFFRDESPYEADEWLSHLVYLHINGELIFKMVTYDFSEGCWANQGGMVRRVWSPRDMVVSGSHIIATSLWTTSRQIAAAEEERMANPGCAEKFMRAFGV